MKEREEERQKAFAKPPSDLSDYAKEIKLSEQKLSVTVYDMLGAFQKVLNRKKSAGRLKLEFQDRKYR